MASSQIPSNTGLSPFARRALALNPAQWVPRAIEALASLKLTVLLLAASIFIVFVGTLAQVDKDMWDVMADYFDSWFAIVKLQVFFPRSWFPEWQNVKGSFPFPGGKLIGFLMMLNLVAAHTVRFQSRARGKQLLIGIGILCAGVLVTTAVIISGQTRGGLQGKPPFEWTTLWTLLKFSLVLAAAGCAWGLSMLEPERRSERNLCWSALGLLIFLIAILYWPGTDLYLGDAGMRILWQLMQGTFAGCVLLLGCHFLFGKRAGVVLLHSGIGLLMIGQLLVSLFAVEERMKIREGETVNYVQDIRAVELAISDTSTDEKDQVVAIPITEKGKETKFSKGKLPGSVSGLPFDIEIVKFFKNSGDLLVAKEGDPNEANAGVGLQYRVTEERPSSGASSEGRVDVAALYAKLTDSATQKELGTYLFSQLLSQQNFIEKIDVNGKVFEASLRFKRQYKPYSVTLKDFRKDDYPGTSIAKNFSSDVQLTDVSRNFDEEIRIRMNEPLRYGGETFYQSSFDFDRDGTEMTDLQVVTNTGWMIPYVACALVGVAMSYHFLLVLVRFLNRLSTSTSTVSPASAALAGHAPAHSASDKGKPKSSRGKSAGSGAELSVGPARALNLRSLAVPAVVLGFSLLLFGYQAKRPGLAEDGFDLYAFGQLPVLEKGRVKPMDTLARNAMRAISNRESFKDHDDRRQPAIRWLLDCITDREAKGAAKTGEPTSLGDDYEIFRIENDDVLHLLGLERRPNLRFSVNELRVKAREFTEHVAQVRERAKKKDEILSSYERKLMELDQRIQVYTMTKFAFSPADLPPLPTDEEMARDPERAKALREAIIRRVMQFEEIDKELARAQSPLAVPQMRGTDGEGDKWIAYTSAANHLTFNRLTKSKETPNPAAVALGQIFQAYADGKPAEFNSAVESYTTLLRRMKPSLYQESKVNFEAWLNKFAPFFVSTYLYVFAFVLTAVGWLVWILGLHRPFNRAAFWLTVATLVVHTIALTLRVYISGRPPVTNLYSSAIFIGWAGVLSGVVIESLFKIGIGNAIASVSGFSTLLIADKLALDGDTMAVMQAVLDTQFWLSTHVVCITLGYAATFVAGLLGVIYVLTGIFTRALNSPVGAALEPSAMGQTATSSVERMTIGKALSTMTYGVMCFAILFSFVGTVLGGLWADDSWGRFWGWDPKENGALIIVLWNALVLHARWDRIVGDRGFAVLSIIGNVVTAWSWFGVNELGVGLHSYGRAEGVLTTLATFVISQFILVGIGMLPWKLWASGRHRPESAA